MKKLTRFVAMVMTLSMLAVSAFAETTDTAAAEDAQVQAETVATDEKQQAEDAVLADTSELDFEESFALLKKIIAEKAG